MRMWMVNPCLMCRQHLLGEHVELHMFVAGIRRGLNLKGYLDKQLLEPHNIRRRHDALARELERRGYRHRSPLPEFVCVRAGRINRHANLTELSRRCEPCCRMQQNGSDQAASQTLPGNMRKTT